MRARWLPTLSLALAGCGAAGDDALTDDALTDDAVTLDTRSAQARAQYDANARFATGYTARCAPRGARPRALVTGFGRFLGNVTNATGQMVSALVPEARYPFTERPPAGAVDAPDAQTSVAVGTVDVPGVGAVDVCAMVLPVYWDLAAILVIKELERFAPSVVVMNGIASSRQDLWIELGSVNRAMTLADGSDVLVPQPPAGQRFAPLVPSATASQTLRGMLLSWDAVRTAARGAIDARAEVTEDGARLDDLLTGASFGGFPRDGNTYLCNNVTYVVNYAMANPARTLTLMQASVARRGAINRVPVRLTKDLRAVPRVFLHWPSSLKGAHLAAGADVLRAVLGAQLRASRSGDPPTLGANDRAELAPSGETF